MLMKLKNISVEEILRPQMYNNLHANVQRRISFEPGLGESVKLVWKDKERAEDKVFTQLEEVLIG